MTLLTAIQGACPHLGIAVPSVVYASTDREHVELVEIAREAVDDIVDAADWHTLKTLATITGDGSAASFALPSDYLRMPKDQQLWSNAQETPLSHVESHNDWLELDIKAFELVLRAWTLLSGEVAIKPTLPSAELVKYYYISNKAIVSSSVNVADFAADGDTLRVSTDGDRLLKLAIIWRWRALKRLDYAEDLNNYQMALDRAIMRDGGAKVIKVGMSRGMSGAQSAYPQAITP